MVAWHVADGSGAAILEMRPCERLQISAHKGTNMPMRGELSMPRLGRHSVRLGNKEFLLIATFCILGLTVSILSPSSVRHLNRQIICSPSKRPADRGFIN
jgi:hypothetical protein